MMNKSLWSSEPWRLFRAFWNVQTGRATLVAHPGESGLLKYHCDQDSNVGIHTFIDQTFLESRPMPLCLGPDFIRVEYRSNPESPHHIDALRSFRVPLGRLESIEGQTNFRIPYWDDRYSFIAVVRMKSTTSAHDYVRTYSSSGQPVPMAQYPATYMSNEWRMNDLGGVSYMMFFLRVNEVFNVAAPEVLEGAGQKQPPLSESLSAFYDVFALSQESGLADTVDQTGELAQMRNSVDPPADHEEMSYHGQESPHDASPSGPGRSAESISRESPRLNESTQRDPSRPFKASWQLEAPQRDQAIPTETTHVSSSQQQGRSTAGEEKRSRR
ncbi:hypothetical protein B0J13DRAFT_641236 [Dactylonectria estremocensis]|uniref:Uncharacterized protein n=1 Tax=Dactylonectria estremocensis TaxID=1079267 RepID=A0A9P9ITD0_9HYPO|nr:hypothetical protein B0J13DRAFT_641236 [Dactylonectria estremocensis]